MTPPLLCCLPCAIKYGGTARWGEPKTYDLDYCPVCGQRALLAPPSDFGNPVFPDLLRG